jgi:hypothetical protein
MMGSTNEVVTGGDRQTNPVSVPWRSPNSNRASDTA